VTFLKSGRGAAGGDCCQNAGWRKMVDKAGVGYPGWSADCFRAMVLAACGNNPWAEEKTTKPERRCYDVSVSLFQGKPAVRSTAKKRSGGTRDRVDRPVRRSGRVNAATTIRRMGDARARHYRAIPQEGIPFLCEVSVVTAPR
jgi:hypothetical protein